MGMLKYQTLVAGVMCMALGACSSMGWGDSNNSGGGSGGSGSSGSSGAGPSNPAPSDPAKGNPAVDSGPANVPSGSGGMATPQTAPTSGNTSPGTSMAPSDTAPSGTTMATPAGAGDAAQSGAMAMYGVVQAIDPMPRAQAMAGAPAGGASGGTDSSGSSGMAATGAGAGAGSSNDMVYRITLKLDDGSMRAFMQESQPSVQIGDRVRIANGTMQRN